MVSRKEGKTKSKKMDLNLYLGPTPSTPPHNHVLGSDLTLNSFIRTNFSDSREIRVPESTPMAIEAISSHASNVFFVESNIPSDIPLPQVFENPISPSYESSCAQWTEESEKRANEYNNPSAELRRNNFDFCNLTPGDTSQDLFQPLEPPNLGLFQSDFCYQNSIVPSLLNGNETNLSRFSSTNSEWLIDETSSSEESFDRNRTIASAEVLVEDKLEKEAEENNRCESNFECNICFDLAKKPVVTSCGHLFCCFCLYQWLYVHSDHKDCPVCKGKVTKDNIIPIHGRGCTKSEDFFADWRSLYAIPQGIGGGIANFWGRFFNMDEDSFNHQVSNELQEEQWVTESEPRTVEMHDLLNNDHLVAMDCEIESAFGRFTENANFYGSTTSVNSPNLGQFPSVPVVGARQDTDQAFSSGNVAVISRESYTRDLSI